MPIRSREIVKESTRVPVYLERAIAAIGDHCGSDCEYARESGSCTLFLEMRKEEVRTGLVTLSTHGERDLVSINGEAPILLTKDEIKKVSVPNTWRRLTACREAQRLAQPERHADSTETFNFGPGV